MSERVARFLERAEAEGLVDVAYAPVDSPIGRLTVAATPRGVVRVMFEREDRDRALQELVDRISPRVLEAPARLDTARRELDEYFAGCRREFDLPLDWTLVRSPFRLRVLEHTATIPFGRLETYRQVAEAAGNVHAMRAAGGALGSNPIPVVVPCHRVIGSNGSLTGYGGGVEIKRFLLAHEGAGVGQAELF
jgi:methylated-DNA-[protein]-cysteine S-methyltransferase